MYKYNRNLLAIAALMFMGLFLFGCASNTAPISITNVSITNVTMIGPNQTTNTTVPSNNTVINPSAQTANVSVLNDSDFNVDNPGTTNLITDQQPSEAPDTSG